MRCRECEFETPKLGRLRNHVYDLHADLYKAVEVIRSDIREKEQSLSDVANEGLRGCYAGNDSYVSKNRERGSDWSLDQNETPLIRYLESLK